MNKATSSGQVAPGVDSSAPGQVWIDTAQITGIETGVDGIRRVRAGIISGWAIGPDPFARIDVIWGGQRVTGARIGLYRPDVARLYPAIPHAEYTGFEASLAGLVVPDEAEQVILLAITTSGAVYVKRHVLPRAGGGMAASQLEMHTHVETCEIDATDTIHIAGWAVAQSQILSVQLLSRGEKIAGTIPGGNRPDVAARFPSYPYAERSGFALVADLRALGHAPEEAVTIEILARDGTLRRVVTTPRRVDQVRLPVAVTALPLPQVTALAAPAPAAPAADEVEQDVWFYCDLVDVDTSGRCNLSGWSTAKAGLAALRLSIGGVEIGKARIGIARSDVAKVFPDLPNGINVGFEFALAHPDGFEAGETTLEATADLRDGSTRSFRIPATITLPQARVSPYDEIVLGVDTFDIVDGFATRTVTGAFALTGWAVARKGVKSIEVLLDGRSLGEAYIGIRRDELQAIFFDFPDTLLAGYALSVPARHLRSGTSRIQIVVTDRVGQQHETEFGIRIDRDAETAQGSLRLKMPWSETRTGLEIMAARGAMPRCDIVIRLDERRALAERLQASLTSLVRQVWPHWRLWLAPAEAKVDAVAALAELTAALPDHADRLGLLADLPQGSSADFIAVLNAGDVLAEDALLAPLLEARAQDLLLYADDRRPDPLASGQMAACFKPGWSPDLLLSQNYIGRAWLARAGLLAQAGLTPADLAMAGDYANILHLTRVAGADAIRHLPGLMLEAGGGRDSISAERRALTAHLRASRLAARVLPGAAPFLHRVARKAAKPGKVSIIIPSIGAKDHVIRCLESIRRHNRDIPVEIVIVDNLRRRGLNAAGKAWKAWFRDHADLVVEVDEPFNWSRLNNLGAAAASGDYLLFLNDDIEILSDDWLEVLTSEAARPEVGVVGAQLLYPDGKVQHAGMFLSRAEPGNARHAFRFAAADDPGYFGLALSQRNVICVTGACMMVRREVFEAVEGFDEAHSVVNNDVDFCLRLHQSGRLVVFTPHARLTHYELASRASLKDVFDRSGFLERWGDLCLAGDPFLNPAISSEADDYAPEEEPLRAVYAGHPLGASSQIRRILVVKLDHIGDLVTALPAFRRIKALFPQAQLTALVGRSAVSIAAMEPAIDALIPFEFFDARSGLGRKKLSKADYAALEADLQGRQFDLAIDLRKQGDTRHILQLSGAPLLAGFDHDQAFPWLDIALEWERDPLRANKRNHVATDLLNLIEAVGTAFTEDRRTIATQTAALPEISEALRGEFAELFTQDYVVIHPAAGTPLRQWSPAHFARLIDLLADEDDLRVALIGGPDERDIAQRVLAAVRRQDRVFNLVGRSRLSEVPRIMAESLLFIGNNSGPSHIASGLGVPTVAVHSALVSSEEWGPLGPSAVALRRDMSCAPCYIASASQCHRAMACLHGISPYAVYRLCRPFLDLRRKG